MHLKEQWIREGFSSYYVVKKEQKLTYEKIFFTIIHFRVFFHVNSGSKMEKNIIIMKQVFTQS